MEHVISSLLGRYERGTLTRRELIQGLAMLTVASGAVSAAAVTVIARCLSMFPSLCKTQRGSDRCPQLYG